MTKKKKKVEEVASEWAMTPKQIATLMQMHERHQAEVNVILRYQIADRDTHLRAFWTELGIPEDAVATADLTAFLFKETQP